MKVLYNSRTEKAIPDQQFVDFDHLLKESDVLCLTANMSKENFQIINKYSLANMKTQALLINTGRGGLIDEEDLFIALQQKQIAGAALDVLAKEPPIANHPLTTLSNCIVTPHIAWASQQARERLLLETATNIMAFKAGKPRNLVNQ